MPLCTFCRREATTFRDDPYRASLDFDGDPCSRCGIEWSDESRMLADEEYLRI